MEMSKNKESTTEIIFIVVWSLLLSMFVLKSIYSCVKRGLLFVVFLWCTFVLLTPIPEGGIIFSYPLEHFAGVHMAISQSIVFLVACTGLLVFRYLQKRGRVIVDVTSNYLLRLIRGPRDVIVLLLLSTISTFAFTFLLQEVLNETRSEVIVPTAITGGMLTLFWLIYVWRLRIKNL